MRLLGVIILLAFSIPVNGQGLGTACDIDRAMEICSALPLDNLEGVWLYPEDKVTVMILRKDSPSASSLPVYDISVVESDDTNLLPGESIGVIEATAESAKYKITLFTERTLNILKKSNTCLANLSKDADALILKGNKSKKFNIRLNINPNQLLPNFWRIVRVSGSTSNNTSSGQEAPVGMVKIYPSYDGNGSSRRQPRYL